MAFRRLAVIGFPDDEADELSALHTRNFMQMLLTHAHGTDRNQARAYGFIQHTETAKWRDQTWAVQS